MMRRKVEPVVTEYLHAKASRLGIPLNGTFEVTPLCNLNCRMCYIRMSREQQEAVAPMRTADEWISLGKTAVEHGMTYLLLTGGEPFSRPDFREIMQSLHRLGLLISINSNGILIDEETVEWLKETPPVRINITVYGASEQTYGRLCGYPEGFQKVVHAIHLLKQAGILVKLNYSVTPWNVDDMEKIFAFAEKEDLVLDATAYMFPPVRRDKEMIGQNARFSPQEAAYYEAWISAYSVGKENYLKYMESGEIKDLAAHMEEDCISPDCEGEGIRCRAGKCSFWITWDGKMLPCGMFLTEHASNVFETGFEECWEKVKDATRAIRLPARCAGCKIKQKCRACAAMVYTESGNYHDVPVYRCTFSHQYLAACEKVESEIRQEVQKNHE